MADTHISKVMPSTAFSNHFSPFNRGCYDRLKAAIAEAELEPLKRRNGIKLNVGWAGELLFKFVPKDKVICEDKQDSLMVTVWAGNTKAQGRRLFAKHINPQIQPSIQAAKKTFNTFNELHIKFSHFRGRFIACLAEGKYDPLGGSIVSAKNFWKHSGRKPKAAWPELEAFFDHSYKTGSEWREECEWVRRFTQPGKKHFDLSFGFGVYCYIPFADLQAIDTDNGDLKPLAAFVRELHSAFQNVVITGVPASEQITAN